MPSLVDIVEICKVSPSLSSSTSIQLPLTYLDVISLNFPPSESLFFYQQPNLSPPFFRSVLLPKLKHTLSFTLSHFLPVAGNLTWPSHSLKPFVLFEPNDCVSLTVAISRADFDHLSGNGVRDSVESSPYVAELVLSETSASVLALQVTLFPKKGFSIGYTSHHGILDGISMSMFMKAWSYVCKNIAEKDIKVSLPPELVPHFDRSTVHDPNEKDVRLLKIWADVKESLQVSKNPRSLKLLSHTGVTNMVMATFNLTPEAINKLKRKALSGVEDTNNTFSTFVITYAYVIVTRVKAQKQMDKGNGKLRFSFAVDCRKRLNPSLPPNYFGNCICGAEPITVSAADFEHGNELSIVADRLSGVIRKLKEKEDLFEDAENILLSRKDTKRERTTGVAGSTNMELYEVDLGWGKPKKVEITSIGRTGAVSMVQSREGNGGVEIGVALQRHEFEVFAAFFDDGLKDE